jgi:hypothetical protein
MHSHVIMALIIGVVIGCAIAVVVIKRQHKPLPNPHHHKRSDEIES